MLRRCVYLGVSPKDIYWMHRKSTNLIMAQAKKKWLAPMLFTSSCTSAIILAWIEKMLIPELTKPSVIVMDNAAFHPKVAIQKLLEQHGNAFATSSLQPRFEPNRKILRCYQKTKAIRSKNEGNSLKKQITSNQ